MTTRSQILRLLADGSFHSGTDLGRVLGISRAAVCKAVTALVERGIEVHRVTGRGYRLAQPLQPLDGGTILAHLAASGIELDDQITVLDAVDSTNHYLLTQVEPPLRSGNVCLAEAQFSGRGRRGRRWVTTPYHNLMLSMAWRFPFGPSLVSGLSLGVGLAVLRALDEYGVQGAGLKWPNDVLWQGRKLAGVMAEVQGEADGPCLVVLGVGINGYIGEREAEKIDQPWVDLYSINGAPVERNRLAALVIKHLRLVCEAYSDGGIESFREEWAQRHLYTGQLVSLLLSDCEIRGTVEGVDNVGALLLRDDEGNCRRFHSGEISLRLAP